MPSSLWVSSPIEAGFSMAFWEVLVVQVWQDCCCVGWVDPFTGNSAMVGWQVASLLGWM